VGQKVGPARKGGKGKNSLQILLSLWAANIRGGKRVLPSNLYLGASLSKEGKKELYFLEALLGVRLP